jgi:hypothetical protein
MAIDFQQQLPVLFDPCPAGGANCGYVFSLMVQEFFSIGFAVLGHVGSPLIAASWGRCSLVDFFFNVWSGEVFALLSDDFISLLGFVLLPPLRLTFPANRLPAVIGRRQLRETL